MCRMITHFMYLWLLLERNQVPNQNIMLLVKVSDLQCTHVPDVQNYATSALFMSDLLHSRRMKLYVETNLQLYVMCRILTFVIS